MNLQRTRYFLSLYFLVFTCDAFYTLVILWGLELVFVLDGVLYGIVAAIIFVIIFLLTVRYSVPVLRKKW